MDKKIEKYKLDAKVSGIITGALTFSGQNSQIINTFGC